MLFLALTKILKMYKFLQDFQVTFEDQWALTLAWQGFGKNNKSIMK